MFLKRQLGIVLIFASSGLSSAMSPSRPDLSQSKTVISDSLVKDLKCSTLSQDTLLTHLQPDALSKERHLSLRNWANLSGMGHCWSLAHAQRLVFFLGQDSESSLFPDPVPSRPEILNMFRGDFTEVRDGGTQVSKQSRTFTVFPMVSIMPQDKSKPADLMEALDTYQDNRFSQLSNLMFLAGDRDRSKSENAATFAQIQANLTQGRLPLVVIRIARAIQHVVLIKDMTELADIVSFSVYDSNYPHYDNFLHYDLDTQEFTAPSIVRHQTPDIDSPIGVFVVDEDDMDEIQKTLMTHYTRRCLSAESALLRSSIADRRKAW